MTAQTSSRIVAVDALRGFALLGIIFAHFIYWYTGAGLPQQVYQMYSDAGSQAVSIINGIFVFGKFFTFFSFLFGLSFFLQMQSLQKKEESFVWRYAWRLAILGVIGLIHHALWRGDILSIYVPLGFILLFVRNISNRLLLIIALLLVFNLPARIMDVIHYFTQKPPTGNTPPSVGEDAQRYYDVIKSGSFFDMIKNNWQGLSTKFAFQFDSGRIYITLGFFMLGTYVGRKKWFENLTDVKPTIKRICKFSGFITLAPIVIAISLFAANQVLKLGWENNRAMLLLFNFLMDFASTAMTIFYLSGLTMLMYRIRWQKWLFTLSYVGKMALTSYVSQTLFGVLLFYHFGLGLFLKTSPAVNILIGFAVYIIQAIFARWWLSRYNYGPVEWLWRSLTFFRWQPMKKMQENADQLATNVG
ncbi:MAG: DUF418 domain-containing protein [Sphingobacteriales bacterium]|nr:DUF418 domain-containing protein [Sphingobacteriales bacterium]MBI3719735.1 DUF418 domain-containing protein [Sphingobacteriales bacterium]